jgi:hypothetical protein
MDTVSLWMTSDVMVLQCRHRIYDGSILHCVLVMLTLMMCCPLLLGIEVFTELTVMTVVDVVSGVPQCTLLRLLLLMLVVRTSFS